VTCSYAVARTVQFRCDHDLHMEPFLFIHAGTCMPKIAERTESLWLSGDRSVLEVLDQILYKAGACSLQRRPHSEGFFTRGAPDTHSFGASACHCQKYCFYSTDSNAHVYASPFSLTSMHRGLRRTLCR